MADILEHIRRVEELRVKIITGERIHFTDEERNLLITMLNGLSETMLRTIGIVGQHQGCGGEASRA